jgi:hypothetical protein
MIRIPYKNFALSSNNMNIHVKDVVYIRKNNAQCYSIKLTIPPVFNIVEAEK